MGPRITAACVIGLVGVIVWSVVYSVAHLFAVSPAWGIVGCVVLFHSVAATHYLGVGR